MTDRLETGRAILRQTMGDEYYEARASGRNDFNGHYRDLIDGYCFGEGWAGGPLTPRDCSLLVITMLATTGRVPELRAHLRGALNNGCTPEEIRHAMTMVGIYAGIPAGVEGFRSAEIVLSEID
ncbi:MAG: carboxymuconolactone decarboxylase family protein [Alphaproteobacteria bacterium]